MPGAMKEKHRGKTKADQLYSQTRKSMMHINQVERLLFYKPTKTYSTSTNSEWIEDFSRRRNIGIDFYSLHAPGSSLLLTDK
jgi:hypothetical protein